MQFWLYLYIAAFLALLAWLYLRKLRQARALQDSLGQLSQARGWQVRHSHEGGRGATLITPGDSTEDWHLHIESGHGAGGRRRVTYVPGVTELTLPGLVWLDGHAFFCQEHDRALTRRVGGTGLIDTIRSDHALRMLGNGVPPDIRSMAAELHSFAPPEGVGMAILATTSPEALDLAAIAETIADWRSRTWSWHSGLPATVTIGPDGMRWRLPDGLDSAEKVDLFLELGLGLARRLEARAAGVS